MTDTQSIIVPVRSIETYPTPFIPGLTWKQRIERCKFELVDSDIWKNIDRFASIDPENENELDIELDHFKKSMTSEEVESSQAKSRTGMISPARFLHLCEVHPDLLRKHPIVCTQAIFVSRHGKVCVLYAGGYGVRLLRSRHRAADWHPSCRFPSTRKVS